MATRTTGLIFVLNTFGVPPPKFVADVSPKVRDVMQSRIMSVTPEATAAEALDMMDGRGIRILPVPDASQRCCGLLSLFKLSKFLFPTANRLVDSRRVLSSLTNLTRIVERGNARRAKSRGRGRPDADDRRDEPRIPLRNA